MKYLLPNIIDNEYEEKKIPLYFCIYNLFFKLIKFRSIIIFYSTFLAFHYPHLIPKHPMMLAQNQFGSSDPRNS